MTGPPTPTVAAQRTVVVVGAATRDIDRADSRGWRLGGGVSYGALTVARLGLPTIAIVGADSDASRARELDLLRDAGVDVRLVPLRHGPVFENRESAAGRVQLSMDAADPLSADAATPDLVGAAAWLLAPIAGELPDAWAGAPSPHAVVGLAWQGLLRRLEPGAVVHRVQPVDTPLLRRANVVGVSRDDLDASVRVADLLALLRPGATLVFTRASEGGLAMEAVTGHAPRLRRYPAIPVAQVVDPTGAGDAFLAAVLAARTAPGLVGGRADRGLDLLLGAVVASFVVEGLGLAGVPGRSAVRQRMREWLRRR